MMEWLLAPIDAARAHDLDLYQAWHGRLMVLAWSILFPLGILVARFFKITPNQDWPNQLDNTFWWHLHRVTQYLGGVAVIVALALIVKQLVRNRRDQLSWRVRLVCDRALRRSISFRMAARQQGRADRPGPRWLTAWRSLRHDVAPTHL